jgi:hypothetical protein
VIADSRDALPVGRWEIIDVIDGFEGWKVHRDVLGLVRKEIYEDVGAYWR